VIAEQRPLPASLEASQALFRRQVKALNEGDFETLKQIFAPGSSARSA
jgi:hypothetical protein